MEKTFNIKGLKNIVVNTVSVSFTQNDLIPREERLRDRKGR
jgi:hypothetical protein